MTAFRPAIRAGGAAVLLAAAFTTCRDAIGPGTGGGMARIAVTPVFPALTATADFGLTIDRIRIIVVRPIADTVADTSVALPPDADYLDLDLRVPLLAARETLSVTIEALAGTLPLFTGTGLVEVRAGAANPPPADVAVTTYVGPGAAIDSIALSPSAPFVYLNDSLRFQVQAFEAGVPVTQFYVAWTTSDTAIARINGFGVLRAPGARTAVEVRARTPSGASAAVPVAFVPLPAQLVPVAGAGQAAAVGEALETPLEVEVRADDGLPVGGVSVRFRALTGGAPADTVVRSDAAGRARVTGILGSAVGLQYFEAKLPDFAGVGAVKFEATALAGAISAATSVVTVGASSVLSGESTLLMLQGKDDAGNLVTSGAASVTFTASGGTSTGTIGQTTDHGDGTYSATFTGITVGTATTIGAVIDSITVTSTPLPTISVLAGAVASVLVTPDAVLLDALNATQEFAADAFDANGNPVSGVTFTWTTSDSLVAAVDATGLATALGNGTTILAATVDGVTGSASLSVAQIATHLAFLAEPSDVVAGDTITPAVQVKALDAGGSIASNFTGSVTLVRNDLIDCGATLLGTTTASAAGGVATFGDLHVLEACVGVQLGAQSDSLAPAQSVPFSVLAGPVATVTVFPASDTLHSLGDTTRFAAQAEDEFGNVITGATFEWTSSDTVVAAVNQTGAATAHANGLAQIVATSGGVAGAAELTVQQIIASVTVIPDQVLLTAIGETVQLAAVALDSGGSTVSDATFTWASSDTLVGTVDTAGLVTAVADGITVVSATAMGVTGSSSITVNLLGAATRLVFVQQPPSMVFFGDTFTVQVAAQDDAGNVVTGFSSSVFLSDSAFSKNSASSLQGPLTAQAVSGVATFSGLFVDGTDTTAIEAIADGLAPDTSVTFEVVDQIVVTEGEGIGRGPYFAAVDTATNRVYVSNSSGSSATIVDGATHKVSNVVSLGANPGWEVVDHRGKQVFISDFVEGSVYVIDEADQVAGTIAVGEAPTQPVLDAEAQVMYVPARATEFLALKTVDLAIREVVAEASIGERGGTAAGTVRDPSTGLIWVAIESEGTVKSVDPAKGVVVDSFFVGEGPYGVALDPKLNRLYVTVSGQSQVWVLDLIEKVALQPIGVGATPQGISVDVETGRVFVANYGDGIERGTISVIDGLDGVVIKTITVGVGPGDAEYNPRNRFVYVPNGTDNTLSIVKPN